MVKREGHCDGAFSGVEKDGKRNFVIEIELSELWRRILKTENQVRLQGRA